MIFIRKWSLCQGSGIVALSLLASAPSTSCAFLTRTLPSRWPLLFHSSVVMEPKISSCKTSRKRTRDDSLDTRSCAHYIKRLFGCTFTACHRSNDDIHEEVTQKEKPKKPTRPLHSYLKVVLDDATMDHLHHISVKLGKDIQTAIISDSQKQEVDERRKRPIRFRYRSRNSLHFTFFFGGQVLCSIPAEELSTWHTDIKGRFCKSQFYLDSEGPIVSQSSAPERVVLESLAPDATIGDEEIEVDKDEYWFRIKKLSLFPPKRGYLIVAILEASPAYHALYRDIRSVALNGDSKELKSLAEKDKGPDWIPHITLGNLYGGTKDDKRAVGEMLEHYSLENGAPDEASNDAIGVKCITMGGPVPQQVELDWDFQNRQRP